MDRNQEKNNSLCLWQPPKFAAKPVQVDDLYVDLLVTAIAADTLSVKPRQSMVGGFTTCGAT